MPWYALPQFPLEPSLHQWNHTSPSFFSSLQQCIPLSVSIWSQPVLGSLSSNSGLASKVGQLLFPGTWPRPVWTVCGGEMGGKGIEGWRRHNGSTGSPPPILKVPSVFATGSTEIASYLVMLVKIHCKWHLGLVSYDKWWEGDGRLP